MPGIQRVEFLEDSSLFTSLSFFFRLSIVGSVLELLMELLID